MDKILEDVENTKRVHGQARRDILEMLRGKNFKVGVEIGVQYGLNVEAVLEEHLAEIIFGIDPYDTNHFQVSGIKDKAYDEPIYQHALERLSKFGQRYIHIRKTSNEAVVNVPGQIDFFYIDGNKNIQAIWDDMTYWYPKLNEGGIMFIHDYNHVSYPHIKKLVDRFTAPLGVKVQVTPGDVAYLIKGGQKTLDRISVVIPFYNTGFYASSVFNEVLDDERIDEVIVVDDCSLPGEVEMLQAVIKNKPKVKYLRNEENVGELRSRIKGAEWVRNEWVIFLDSDNSLTKEYLDALYKIPHWRQDTIYHPSFGNKKHIDYTSWEGDHIGRGNIRKYLNEEPYKTKMFLNTGNYFMQNHNYLLTAYKHQMVPKYQYGDVVINAQWINDRNFIFIVPGMHYVHRMRKDSTWKEHQDEMLPKFNETIEKLK